MAGTEDLEGALQLSREAIQAYCDSENEMRAERDALRAKLEQAREALNSVVSGEESPSVVLIAIGRALTALSEEA